jgi:hypothetical protein
MNLDHDIYIVGPTFKFSGPKERVGLTGEANLTHGLKRDLEDLNSAIRRRSVKFTNHWNERDDRDSLPAHGDPEF